jgi:hypothetical protein
MQLGLVQCLVQHEVFSLLTLRSPKDYIITVRRPQKRIQERRLSTEGRKVLKVDLKVHFSKKKRANVQSAATKEGPSNDQILTTDLRED